jgi:hypothetical protein
MVREWDVRFEKEIAAPPQAVWDTITRHSDGYVWPVEYEPRVGGAERGMTQGGGTVTVWEPARHFATEANGVEGEFNELDYRLEPLGEATLLRTSHRTRVPADEFDVQLDACRQHTAFYLHSLGQHACHFAGRSAVYVSADGPASSAQGGLARLREALGLPTVPVAGEPVHLTPQGLDPIDGVVDYAAGPFLGIRTQDALLRVYGRDAWGWPAGIAHHVFAEDADGEALQRAWSDWVAGVLGAARVA